MAQIKVEMDKMTPAQILALNENAMEKIADRVTGVLIVDQVKTA